jgi:putative aldouronate transport system substrate-binding protein
MKKTSIIRKASVAALSVLLVASLLAGCSGNRSNAGNSQPSISDPKVETDPAVTKAEPLGKQQELTVISRGVSLDPNQKYPEGQSLDDNAYTKMLKEKFNIQIENTFTASAALYEVKEEAYSVYFPVERPLNRRCWYI